jgi:glucose-6-phosphate 1-dehydrogenase
MAAVTVEPHLFIVLGGTGDLMHRKLLPALYRLSAGGIVKNPLILGVGRKTTVDDDSFRIWAQEALAASGLGEQGAAAPWCAGCLHYQPLDSPGENDYRALGARVAALEEKYQLPGNRVFYLAIPPNDLPEIIAGLGEAGLNRSSGWTRLVVEKPFGLDLGSAQELNRLAHHYFEESQIYRIDHYLGKETVQNLLVFRFGNAIFEPVWNRDLVQSVQITVAETLGVEKRAHYYESVGALRDMVQNHLTQLLTIATMEVPSAFEADAIREEKAKVLRSVPPLKPEDVVFGQYARGAVQGQEVPGYREEAGVAPDSREETFVALKMEVANWRWQGVPFYLRTGKRLPRQVTQIAVTFKCPPVSVFQPYSTCLIHSNVLVFTIQPDEGFDLYFEVKAPGTPLKLNTQKLSFRYAEAFGPLPDAYETLLLDVLIGDQTLFVRADEVEEAWRIYNPILGTPPEAHPYPAGAWGPPEAARLLDWQD